MRFWLTHRLTSQLIPVLPFQARPLDGADCQMSKDHPSNQSVNSESGSSSVVECGEDCEEFLVVSIEVRCHQDRITLVFKDLEEKHRASMSLDLDGRSQFAGALDTCFRAAGWPADENKSSLSDLHVSALVRSYSLVGSTAGPRPANALCNDTRQIFRMTICIGAIPWVCQARERGGRPPRGAIDIRNCD